ncbi:phytanoyl-CoA dioxygenase family protein [Vulcanococcus limneticus]|uniref:phytanoyl-CoA dioxygenase family protein n=1 Tax=Vulcanococcus limneticus TaxID=2170428 RepID=UPI00398BE271
MASASVNLPWVDLVPPCAYPQTDFDRLATDGVLIKRSFIDPALIDRIREWTIDRYAQPDMEGIGRIQDAYAECDAVRALATDSGVLALLQELYQRRPLPFQTLNFLHGTQQATHSDTIHFHCFPQRWMCGVWVAMEDVDMNNGPLHYYPGSHRLPVLDAHDTSCLSGRYDLYEQAIQNLIAITELQVRQFLPKKGDCLIWTANLLHGGDPILDRSRTRISQVTHYYFEGCDYYTPLQSDFSRAQSQITYRDALVDLSTGQPILAASLQQGSATTTGES